MFDVEDLKTSLSEECSPFRGAIISDVAGVPKQLEALKECVLTGIFRGGRVDEHEQTTGSKYPMNL
jgi:hypothetical protein